jgi:hypothetical protein
MGEDALRLWIDSETANRTIRVLHLILIAIIINSLGFIPGELAIGKARPEFVTGMTIFKGTVMLIMGPVAIHYFELNGIGIAHIIGAISTVPYLYYIRKVFFEESVSLIDYFSALFYPVIIGGLISFFLYYLYDFLNLHAGHFLNLFLYLIVMNIVILSGILGISWCFPRYRFLATGFIRIIYGLFQGYFKSKAIPAS